VSPGVAGTIAIEVAHKIDYEHQPHHYEREDESDQVLRGVDDRITPAARYFCSVLGSSAQSLRESSAQSLRGRAVTG
jgi:hypothetical protein